jgi:hypothetical protein
VRKKAKRRERKRKERMKRKEKNGKIAKPENFREKNKKIIYGLDLKIKDNFWSQSENYFCKRKE